MRKALGIIAVLVMLAAAAAFWSQPAVAATWGSPVVVSGLDGNEPGVDVAADGTVYITAIPGIFIPGPSPSYVWRSDTGGTSWTLTPAGARATQPGGGDSDIALDPDNGAIYFSDLWLGNSTVAVSKDKGNTWIAQPFGSTPVEDRNWQATPGSNRVYLVSNTGASGLVVSRSIDGGITYPQSSLASSAVDRGNCFCPPGNIIATKGATGGVTDDRVGVISYIFPTGIRFSRSTNGGLTFSSIMLSPGESKWDPTFAFPVVADAGANTLVAVWQEVNPGGKKGAGASTRLRFARSTDWGATWSASTTLPLPSGTPLYPWIAARGSKVSISLFFTPDAVTTPDRAPSSAKWYEYYIESTNGGASWSPAVRLDATPVKSGPVCLDGFNCTSNRELGDFQQVAVGPTGLAYATWTRSINNKDDTEVRFARQF